MKIKTILIAVAALVVGATAGWFAGKMVVTGTGERGTGNGERIPLSN